MKTINTDYLFRMTDDTGMFQHGKFGVPDRAYGYTTDDNARALLVVVLLYEKTKEPRYLTLVVRYLSFLLYAREDGWFRNFMRYDRVFEELEISQDCYGRCIWALSYVVAAPSLGEDIKNVARVLVGETKESRKMFRHLRSRAYTLLGLCNWEDERYGAEARQLAQELLEAYAENKKEDWHWYEEKLTSANAVIPLSLLQYALRYKNETASAVGLESLAFLLKHTIDAQDIFRPIGCNGWYVYGGIRAAYDEQPIEACKTYLAAKAALQLTKEKHYQEVMEICKAWFFGKNSKQAMLIDEETGGCRDGIGEKEINLNMGAESLLVWLMISLM
ncbi:MAG: glycosyltransferase [Christensenellaceae bacterium]|jgi:hypothetical protein